MGQKQSRQTYNKNDHNFQINMPIGREHFCQQQVNSLLIDFHTNLMPMSICYLNPGPSVILGCGPGVHKTLLIQPGKVGVPFLEAEESSVSGGGRYLLVRDDSTLHAQWTGTFCSIHRNNTWMERLDIQCTDSASCIMDLSTKLLLAHHKFYVKVYVGSSKLSSKNSLSGACL